MFIYALVIELSARLFSTIRSVFLDYSHENWQRIWNVLCKLIELFLALSHQFSHEICTTSIISFVHQHRMSENIGQCGVL